MQSDIGYNNVGNGACAEPAPSRGLAFAVLPVRTSYRPPLHELLRFILWRSYGWMSSSWYRPTRDLFCNGYNVMAYAQNIRHVEVQHNLYVSKDNAYTPAIPLCIVQR